MKSGILTTRLRSRWRSIPTTRSVIIVMGAVLVVHVAISKLIDLPQADGVDEVLLGVAYFVLGILAAFAIDGARTGLSRVSELLKAGDADLISIYQLSTLFGSDAQRALRETIDEHLQDQIDYRLVDFERSTPSFLTLFARVRDLKPSSTEQEIAYDHLLGLCTSTSERRKQLEALVRQRISTVEWVTLLSLFIALWGLILTVNGDDTISAVLGGVLVASLAGLLVLLRHLDEFRWQENDAIWTPLHNLFVSLDLLPYYPRIVVETGRIDPPTGRIRLANYPHPYPDMRGKTTAEVDHEAKAR